MPLEHVLRERAVVDAHADAVGPLLEDDPGIAGNLCIPGRVRQPQERGEQRHAGNGRKQAPWKRMIVHGSSPPCPPAPDDSIDTCSLP